MKVRSQMAQSSIPGLGILATDDHIDVGLDSRDVLAYTHRDGAYPGGGVADYPQVDRLVGIARLECVQGLLLPRYADMSPDPR